MERKRCQEPIVHEGTGKAERSGTGVFVTIGYGATDEFGYKAVESVATIYDLHATLLHLLGLDHERLSFYHNGIERRLTDVHGHVLGGILA